MQHLNFTVRVLTFFFLNLVLHHLFVRVVICTLSNVDLFVVRFDSIKFPYRSDTRVNRGIHYTIDAAKPENSLRSKTQTEYIIPIVYTWVMIYETYIIGYNIAHIYYQLYIGIRI